MKPSRLVLPILVALFHTQHTLAQDHSLAISEARASLERFIEKWNSIDDAAVREELSFPHISHGPNDFVVIEQAQDWFVGYDNLRQQGGVLAPLTISPHAEPLKTKFISL